jgi:hypothetical protein
MLLLLLLLLRLAVSRTTAVQPLIAGQHSFDGSPTSLESGPLAVVLRPLLAYRCGWLSGLRNASWLCVGGVVVPARWLAILSVIKARHWLLLLSC